MKCFMTESNPEAITSYRCSRQYSKTNYSPACTISLQTFPCQITLSEGKSDELLRELSAHRIDIVVSNFLPIGPDAKGLIPKSIIKRTWPFGAPKFKNSKRLSKINFRRASDFANL